LAALAGFWFVQLVDSVFSVSPSLAAAYECSALNFSLVDGHQKFLSGLSLFFCCSGQTRKYVLYACKLCLCRSHTNCTVYKVYQNGSLGIGSDHPTVSQYTNVSFYGLPSASHHPNASLLSIVGAAAAGATISGKRTLDTTPSSLSMRFPRSLCVFL
jgi:hypothetical protein